MLHRSGLKMNGTLSYTHITKMAITFALCSLRLFLNNFNDKLSSSAVTKRAEKNRLRNCSDTVLSRKNEFDCQLLFLVSMNSPDALVKVQRVNKKISVPVSIKKSLYSIFFYTYSWFSPDAQTISLWCKPQPVWDLHCLFRMQMLVCDIVRTVQYVRVGHFFR